MTFVIRMYECLLCLIQLPVFEAQQINCSATHAGDKVATT